MKTPKKRAERATFTCEECGKEFETFAHRNAQFCGRDCKKAHNDVKARRWSLFARDSFQCVYCGRSSVEHGVALHLDHIEPRSLGGDDTAGNLVTACQSCNCAKRDVLLPPDVESRLLAEVSRRNSTAKIDPNKIFDVF